LVRTGNLHDDLLQGATSFELRQPEGAGSAPACSSVRICPTRSPDHPPRRKLGDVIRMGSTPETPEENEEVFVKKAIRECKICPR
ncbi:MAG: hypothetical protein ACKV2T_27375, partial [Kofleriaceae bacterium]